MVFNYLEESGLGNKLVEIIAEALEPIIEEIRKGEIKMFKDNNTVSTGPCGEPIPAPTLCDKCHLIAAEVHENILLASRIREILLGNKNAANENASNPSCMDEEFTLIHEDLQYLRKILVDINERL